MAERVSGVVTRQGQDISDLVNTVADRYGFPPRLLVACAIQESNLDEHSERRAAWPDTSAGLFHQAVKWAQSYGLGDGSASPENVAAVFDVLQHDVERAADIAGRQLGHWWAQEQDGPEALSRYNRPASSLAENRNRANILRGWEASAVYVVPEEAPMGYTPHVDHDPGTVAGHFAATPDGLILHGSRSGVPGRPVQTEYDATRRFATSGIELGWNATVGEDTISLHMSPREWGWNARAASRRYLAVELAQPTVHDPITDGQVRALCWWILEHVLPVWPDLDVASLPMHSELPTGMADGKTDCFPRGDPRGDELRARIIAELTQDAPAEEMDDMAIAAEQARIALEEIIPNCQKVLAMADLPEEAREAVQFGIQPAAETIVRNGGLEVPA